MIRLVPAVHVVAGFTKCECNSKDSCGVAEFTGSIFFNSSHVTCKELAKAVKVVCIHLFNSTVNVDINLFRGCYTFLQLF